MSRADAGDSEKPGQSVFRLHDQTGELCTKRCYRRQRCGRVVSAENPSTGIIPPVTMVTSYLSSNKQVSEMRLCARQVPDAQQNADIRKERTPRHGHQPSTNSQRFSG
jgi:hypothetical protein